MKKYGLIGKNIDYSFSKDFFTKKVFPSYPSQKLEYVNFDIENIEKVKLILKDKDVAGLNVTIPYKEQIITYLDDIEDEAESVGAVNTIYFTKDRKKIGFNTDIYGFEQTLKQTKKTFSNALILGTGGASKAVKFVLEKNKIDAKFITRNPSESTHISYENLTMEEVNLNKLIINCTPLGTFPNISESPSIPYDGITNKHCLIDLIYNPRETLFLKQGKKRGAIVLNGLHMLENQAMKSWQIWNS